MEARTSGSCSSASASSAGPAPGRPTGGRLRGGGAMAVFFTRANGLGRLAWGAISDRVGRKNSVVVMAATQGVLLFLFIPMAGSGWLLYLGGAPVGFHFGRH